jgi:glutathione S-transferase
MSVQFAYVSGGSPRVKWWYGSDWSMMDAYLNWCWFRATGAGFDPTPFPRLATDAERISR